MANFTFAEYNTDKVQLGSQDDIRDGVSGSVSSASIFLPTANTYAGIMDAYNAAVAAGGGTIKLAAVDYAITASLPLTSGISYCGVETILVSYRSSAPDIGAAPVGGTRLILSPGVIAMAGRTTPGAHWTGSVVGTTLTVASIVADVTGSFGILDVNSRVLWPGDTETYIVAQLSGTPNGVGTYQLTVSQTTNASITDGRTWRCEYISGITVEKLVFVGGRKAIQCGAFNTQGSSFSHFEDLYAYDTTEEPFDHYNFEHNTFFRNFSFNCAHGPRYIMYSGAQMGGLGNSRLEKIYDYKNNKPLARGIILGSPIDQPGFGGLGDAYEIQANHYNRVKQTATFTCNGTADISVPNASLLPVGMPIRFATTARGFTGGTYVGGQDQTRPAYFVTSSNTSTNIIQLSIEPSGSVNMLPTAGTITGEWHGLPPIIIAGGKEASFGACFKNLDVEGVGNMILFLRLSQARVETVFASNQDESSLCFRNCFNVTVIPAFASWADVASSCDTIMFMGIQPCINTGTVYGDRVIGWGDEVVRNLGIVLRLGKYTGPGNLCTLSSVSPGFGELTKPEIPIAAVQKYYTATARNCNTADYADFYTYTGTGAAVWTWTQYSNVEMRGGRFTFKNKGTGTLTITLDASNGTFDGMTGGVSVGKSMILSAPTASAAGGALTMVSCEISSGVWQWQIESMLNAALV